MNLKRTVYHIAGKDYEAMQWITFTFHVQRVSIENFLNLATYGAWKVRRLVKSISPYFDDHMHTWVDRSMKSITIECMAETLAIILDKLGITGDHAIATNDLWVRKHDLRAVQDVTYQRYNGISVFDPITRKQWYTSGTPKKIEGRQAIINGKLWRKYTTQ